MSLYWVINFGYVNAVDKKLADNGNILYKMKDLFQENTFLVASLLHSASFPIKKYDFNWDLW